MKGVETGVCQNNDGGTRTLVDSDTNQSTQSAEGRCLWYVGSCGAGVNYSMAFKIDIAIQY